MEDLKERYVNPFTDFGFKRLFGQEANKELLIDFLNEVFKDEQESIVDLTYHKNERLGEIEPDRKAIFDIYCENEKGEKFVVEMQKNEQHFFKDRSIYYSTFPIRDQAKKSLWDYKLKAVYMISILGFSHDCPPEEKDKFRYDVQLMEKNTKKPFYEKLNFIYFEMPKFRKKLEDLETRYEKWLYLLKNLTELNNLPARFEDRVFEHFFELAEIAKFSRDERDVYEGTLKHYRDNKNTFETAQEKAEEEGREKGLKQGLEQGLEQGREEGMEKREKEITLNLIRAGLDNNTILKATGLTTQEIQKLRT